MVAVVGQPLAVALLASDLDQDPLTWIVDGLPLGAELRLASQYGQATLAWTPTADDVGNHEIELIVSDSGLPPRDAGYIEPADPVPNVSRHSLRIVVRADNAAPRTARAAGRRRDASPTMAARCASMPEKVRRWRSTSSAMMPTPTSSTGRCSTCRAACRRPRTDNRLSLAWTPDRFCRAGQQHRRPPGLWRFTVTGSDGMATFSRTLEVAVANVNQAPRLLPLPLQLVNEGETLHFTVRAADADHDAVQLALLHDDSTPPGVAFNPASGSFEWTPDQDTVDNGNADSRPYTFTFRASDGLAVATQTGTGARLRPQPPAADQRRQSRRRRRRHALAPGRLRRLGEQRHRRRRPRWRSPDRRH